MADIALKVELPTGTHTVLPHRYSQARLTEILRHENMPLNTRCGEKSHCDGCIVELLEGQVVHVSTGQIVSANSHPLPIRACEHRLGPVDAAIRVPPRSMLAYEPHVQTDFRINVPRAHDPLWQQVELSAQEAADADTLRKAVAKRRNMSALPEVEGALNLCDFAGKNPVATIEYRGGKWAITGLSSTPRRGLGVAVDIGTTTVAVLLIDMSTGQILAQSAGFNQQMHLGDDVLTRIGLCSTEGMLKRLQHAVASDTIGKLLDEALDQANASHSDVRCMAVSGNTTMLHLFAAVDPTSMGVAPFTPTFLNHRVLRGRDVWPGKGDDPSIHLLPGAAAYVGADLTAGALASGLLYDAGPSLLVDVGTNGEIILKVGDKLYGCATAAGPAFEGAGLSCGLRAGDGAINHIEIGGSPLGIRAKILGPENTIPTGICGSAYIDFLAEARRLEFLNPAGRFERDCIPETITIIPWNEHDQAMRIGIGHGKRDVVISQADVAALLQAKAAIAAGLLTLIARQDLTPADIKTVYLAGGFGTHMNRQSAIGCGLLPGFKPEQIQPVGNTALGGALLALLDTGALGELARVGSQMEIVELNLDPNFETTYIDQLML